MGVEILVLSEDRGQGFETIAAILKRLLRTHGSTGEPLLKLIPAEDRMVWEAAHANLWKSSSKDDYQKKVSLRRTIATSLQLGALWCFTTTAIPLGPTTLISSRRDNSSGNWEYLCDSYFKDPDSNVVESRMARLIQVTPHYSIEAWTYQAAEQAIGICRNSSGRDVDKFEQWSSDRGALDEVVKPKDETCLNNKHNFELAEHVPCKEVLAVGKSFAELLRRLQLCSELRPLIRDALSV